MLENNSEAAVDDDEQISKDTSSKCFHLLNALSDLMMLPKDLLLSQTVRKEVRESLNTLFFFSLIFVNTHFLTPFVLSIFRYVLHLVLSLLEGFSTFSSPMSFAPIQFPQLYLKP